MVQAETAKTREARHTLRRKTRAAQKFAEQRERDLRYGRPTRDLTAEEVELLAISARSPRDLRAISSARALGCLIWQVELLAGADGLYERLKGEKAAEKEFWLSKVKPPIGQRTDCPALCTALH